MASVWLGSDAFLYVFIKVLDITLTAIRWTNSDWNSCTTSQSLTDKAKGYFLYIKRLLYNDGDFWQRR